MRALHDCVKSFVGQGNPSLVDFAIAGALYHSMKTNDLLGHRKSFPYSLSSLEYRIGCIRKDVVENIKSAAKKPDPRTHVSGQSLDNIDPFNGKNLDNLDELLEFNIECIGLDEKKLMERQKLLGLDDLVL